MKVFIPRVLLRKTKGLFNGTFAPGIYWFWMVYTP